MIQNSWGWHQCSSILMHLDTLLWYLQCKVITIYISTHYKSPVSCFSRLHSCVWYSKTVILWNIITILNNCFLLQYIFKCNLLLWRQSSVFSNHYSSLCHMILQKLFWYADLVLKKHVLLLSIPFNAIIMLLFLWKPWFIIYTMYCILNKST